MKLPPCLLLPMLLGCGPAPIVQYVATADEVCALRADHSIDCRSIDYPDEDHPVLFPPEAPRLHGLAAASFVVCGLDSEGMAHCWGNGEDGRQPILEPPPVAFSQIFGTEAVFCGLRAEDAEIQCWGVYSGSEQVMEHPPQGPFVRVMNASGHIWAERPDGSVAMKCVTEAAHNADPLPNWSQPGFSSMRGGHFCSIFDEGELRCMIRRGRSFGYDERQPDGFGFKEVAVGSQHVCALKEGGEVQCWGDNQAGQLQVPERKFKSIRAGAHFTCGEPADPRMGEELLCWGCGEEESESSSLFTRGGGHCEWGRP